jgi:hypothetical protein
VEYIFDSERRRSGRKNLAQDLEHLPASAALAYNLKDADYVSIVCGSLDKLPQALPAWIKKNKVDGKKAWLQQNPKI